MENITTQIINIKILEDNVIVPVTPGVPGTGLESILVTVGNFISSHLILVLGIMFTLTLIMLFFVLYRHFVSKKPYSYRTKLNLGITVITIISMTAFTISSINLVNATASLNLDTQTLNTTISKPNLSTTTSDTLSVTTDTIAHNLDATIDSISDSRIAIEVNNEALSNLTTTLATDSTNTSYTLDYDITIDSSLPVGDYIALVSYTVEEVADPPLVLPLGVLDNISPTNPAVMDVYPTTGWADEIVIITSNALFTDVQNVTIGGTKCTQYTVVNSSVILCKLPTKTAGTANDIVVMNGTSPSINVTPASTYTHMKITYFDPDSDTINIGGTTFDYYPNGFTSADCSVLVPSNSTALNLPDSIVYIRDIRNNQVYKVKRMIDNKCWMIDNLKYIDTSIVNYDGTNGTVFNNQVGMYNTIDGSATQSITNSNKAFFNNPMETADCYSGSTINMAANTLTHCGYAYNWYGATAGAGTYSLSTNGNQATGNICPANFRLPSGMSSTGGPTTDGIAYTHADFSVLSASMNVGAITTGSTNNSFYANWLPSGAWSGTYSGRWNVGFDYQGYYGYYWSSTASSNTNVRPMYFSDSIVYPGSSNYNKYSGLFVRCVL